MIHSNVALLMKVLKLKIPDLAELAEMNESTIKKARSHASIESCRLESLCKIADVLNVSFDDLFVFVHENTKDRS